MVSSMLAIEGTTLTTILCPRLELISLLLDSALGTVAIEITVRSQGICESSNLFQCEPCVVFGMLPIGITTVTPEIPSRSELIPSLLSVTKRLVALEIMIRPQRGDGTFDLP